MASDLINQNSDWQPDMNGLWPTILIQDIPWEFICYHYPSGKPKIFCLAVEDFFSTQKNAENCCFFWGWFVALCLPQKTTVPFAMIRQSSRGGVCGSTAAQVAQNIPLCWCQYMSTGSIYIIYYYVLYIYIRFLYCYIAIYNYNYICNCM